MTSGIRFDSVTVAYDGNVVLDALDLTVGPGEVMALLGPSGSGKTTALRAVAGFVRPVSGRVFLAGRRQGTAPEVRAEGRWVGQRRRQGRRRDLDLRRQQLLRLRLQQEGAEAGADDLGRAARRQVQEQAPVLDPGCRR